MRSSLFFAAAAASGATALNAPVFARATTTGADVASACETAAISLLGLTSSLDLAMPTALASALATITTSGDPCTWGSAVPSSMQSDYSSWSSGVASVINANSAVFSTLQSCLPAVESGTALANDQSSIALFTSFAQCGSSSDKKNGGGFACMPRPTAAAMGAAVIMGAAAML